VGPYHLHVLDRDESSVVYAVADCPVITPFPPLSGGDAVAVAARLGPSLAV